MRALRTIIVVLLVSLGFLGGYFVGWYLHGENAVRLSTTQQSSAKDAGKLQQRIIEELQSRYYVPVNVNKLSTAGVNGMLKSLQDPYTVYLTPKEVQDFAEKQQGSYSGIGASLQKTKDGLVISTVFAGSPAKAAGLVPGDIIQAVDGQSTKDAAIETSISRIKGAEGSTVTLTIQPKDAKQPPKEIKLVRKTIEIPETSKRIINDKGTKVGYIQLYEFGGLAGADVRKDVEALKKQGAQWFILDLRYNGGGLLTQAVEVTDVFQTGLVTSTSGLHSPKEELNATGPVATKKSHGRAGQRVLGQRLRDRHGRAQGPQAGDDHRHDDLRQGPGADHHRPRQRGRAQAHHGRVPHAERHQHQQEGHHAGHRGARQAEDEDRRRVADGAAVHRPAREVAS